MLFTTMVLEFWIMETTNIYEFLHLLSLIKIKPNMDFEGEFGICTYMPQYIFFSFLSQREWKNAHINRPN
jgi:hypothetical protein